MAPGMVIMILKVGIPKCDVVIQVNEKSVDGELGIRTLGSGS